MKAVKGWAVVDKRGEILVFTVRETRKWAIGAIETLAGHEWKELRKAGYRCIRVTITAEETPHE